MTKYSTQSRPFAVFDIDGTLIRWQLYHAVADDMAKQNIINPQKYQAVLRARNNWQSRQSVDSFSEYEQSLINLINLSIIGLDHLIFQQICQTIVNRFQDQVYAFTRDLIANLKSQGYLIFAISASPQELVSLVADHYNFDDYGGSSYEVINNHLSGKQNLLFGQAKTIYLKKLIAKHHATMSGSIGVGDTLGDLQMLNTVERAIAFNPSKELYDHALNNKWNIIIERKNVVYRLIHKDGQYILASTD